MKTLREKQGYPNQVWSLANSKKKKKKNRTKFLTAYKQNRKQKLKYKNLKTIKECRCCYCIQEKSCLRKLMRSTNVANGKWYLI
jgi:hypothetical protein